MTNKKALIVTLILVTFNLTLSANNFFSNKKEVSFNGNKQAVEENKQEAKFTRKFANLVVGDFMEITGENEFQYNKYLDTAMKDKDWLKANEYFYFEKKIIDLKGIAKAKIPKWKKALELYKISSDKGNILASYQGINLITKYFTQLNPTMDNGQDVIENIINKYMGTFSEKLREKNYCYGYLYNLRYYVNYKNDIGKAISVGEMGYPICKDQLSKKLIPKWLDLAFRKDFVKAKTIVRVREAKAEFEQRGY